MEYIIWMIIAIIMTIMTAFLAVYLSLYKKNIKQINEEMKLILKEDTNYLVTTTLNTKEIQEMVTLINQNISSANKIKMKLMKTNRIFRESITGVSHDLRTPLTSAGGFVQLLKKKNITKDQQKEYIEIILERIQTVRNLLDQLFLYTRIEADEMELTQEPVNVKNILYDILSLYYQDFSKLGEEPIINVPKDLCIVNGNEDALKRILTNIIYNAVIHGDGDYKFEILIIENKIQIICSNITNSIKEDEVKYLFDRFYTSDHSRSLRRTGIGLAVAKRLTELMGGSIHADLVENRINIVIELLKSG